VNSKSAFVRSLQAHGTSVRFRLAGALILTTAGIFAGIFVCQEKEANNITTATELGARAHVKRASKIAVPPNSNLMRVSGQAFAEKPLGAEQDAPPTSDDWDDNVLGDLLRNIVDEDKNLGTFLYYYEHVLLDSESRKQYDKLLSDEQMYAEIKHDLLYPGETQETLQGNVKRMLKIDYLHEALEWDENPSRDALLDTIEQILLEDNFTDELGTDMRLSLATNKMELYALLFDKAPARAAGVVEGAKGTRLEALIDFIADSIALRRKTELSLASEVRP
jgi:hypothetical protein